METRTNKSQTKEIITDEATTTQTRSSRNAKLYKHIYGEYEDLDNLPIEDNTNEIDMEKLRELVLAANHSTEDKQLKENLNILEQRKRMIDEQKVYDINKILEKAKYENNKLKEPAKDISKPKRDLLTTLGSAELSLDEINAAKKQYQEQMNKKKQAVDLEAELSMTRELKYKNLGQLEAKSEEQVEKNLEDKTLLDTNSLSLDLFNDLKPTENTIITKPIIPDEYDDTKYKKESSSLTDIKSDIRSGDTRDIDIIKEPPPTNPASNADEFFTNVYEFSKKDFADVDDDFFDTPKKGGLFKIFLLILAIIIVIGVIIYFIGTYGSGIA